MPRTKKLEHKQTGWKPKDSSTSYRTFQTNADQDKYQKYNSDRTFCAEKGFCCRIPPPWDMKSLSPQPSLSTGGSSFVLIQPKRLCPLYANFMPILREKGSEVFMSMVCSYPLIRTPSTSFTVLTMLRTFIQSMLPMPLLNGWNVR